MTADVPGPPDPDVRREPTHSLGSAGVQQCGQGLAVLPWDSGSRLHEEQVQPATCAWGCVRLTLMPAGSSVGSILGIGREVQEEGGGGRASSGVMGTG